MLTGFSFYRNHAILLHMVALCAPFADCGGVSAPRRDNDAGATKDVNLESLLALFGRPDGGDGGNVLLTAHERKIVDGMNAYLDDPARVAGDIDVRAHLIESEFTAALTPDTKTVQAFRAMADALEWAIADNPKPAEARDEVRGYGL